MRVARASRRCLRSSHAAERRAARCLLQAAARGTTPASHLPLRPGRHRQVHTDTASHCVLAFARAARAAHGV
eukprot:129737-Prymnesium_polylepis.1